MKPGLTALLCLALANSCLLSAQPAAPGTERPAPDIPFLKIAKTNTTFQLDGRLDEPLWQQAMPATNFWLWFPTDSLRAEYQTEVRMTYDDATLYIGVKCHSKGKKYVVESLRRDYRAGGNDNLTLIFDPFNDKTNAFFFGVNPEGVLREGLISNGGLELEHFSEAWDNKWEGEAYIGEGFWSAELAIPFKTLRFEAGSTRWRFNCYRFDTQTNERSTWNRIPRNQWIFNVGYAGDLVWDEPLHTSGASVALIPYLSADGSRDFEAGEGKYRRDLHLGGDAKIAITSGLNLDLTMNPDFSQVEVDRQVTNLQRFEVFFPERRQFFLENADLFGSFGNQRINPFFSRRIGVALDTSTGQNIQNPIYFGARLNGKLNENWRLGLLDMQTAPDDGNGLPGFNYAVAALQRKVFSRSNVGLILVNKQSFESLSDSSDYRQYNRIFGLDYNLTTPGNSWSGKAFYHRAITPVDSLDGKFAQGLDIGYKVKRYEIRWAHEWVGEGFDAEVGYVPRKDYFQMSPLANLFFYPKSGGIVQHGPGISSLLLLTPGYGRTDHELHLLWNFEFRGNGLLTLDLKNEYTYLFEDFDPTRQEEHFLPAGSDYAYTNFSLLYMSDRARRVSVFLEPKIGQFFNGFRAGMGGSVMYRFQPFGTVSLNFNYNYLDFAAPFEPVSLYLVGPRFDLTFTKKLFLTAFFQYNSQIDNVNINARLQWRFKPVSDFFLVYTDNYAPEGWSVKNRAIVAKLTYWLNL